MIKIGTRDSKLALYQATQVQQRLKFLGIDAELVYIKTIGDIDQTTPLSAFKNPGIFANEVNQKVLSGEVDLGVHSCKDMPSRLDEGLELGAVLERADPNDTLVYKPSFVHKLENGERLLIATSSERRRMQWLEKYPNSEIFELRGNIPTRLQKLQDSEWDGAIYAQAALDRLEIVPKLSMPIDSFVPAACQGTIAIVNRTSDKALQVALNKMNHQQTFVQTQLERAVLQKMQIGCSTPFGCQAQYEENGLISLRAQLFNKDGSQSIKASQSGLPLKAGDLVELLVTELNGQGAKDFLSEM